MASFEQIEEYAERHSRAHFMACTGHVLSERFRVSRDMLADVGGNRARPQT